MLNGVMPLRHVMAATDESDAGRQAVHAALRIASLAGARASILRVLPFDGARTQDAVEQLRRWVESDLPALHPPPPIEYAVANGVPGVEIARVGEWMRADLLVLGRKHRSQAMRLLLGDTADAVARRSHVPCLFVPAACTRARRVLVALDGSGRGAAVLWVANDFARQIGAELRVMTVERVYAGEPAELAVGTPAARTTRIRAEVDRTLALELEVRRGEIPEQILAAVEEDACDVLVIGCHRGGPAGVIEAGSTGRRVIHEAPCAVLTVPL
jgi:nucleotide-binding universal stress UspA family protein